MSKNPEFPCDHVSHVFLGVLSIEDAVKLLQLTSCQLFQWDLSKFLQQLEVLLWKDFHCRLS